MDILNQVEKPIRYIGSEWNAVLKKPQARLRFAFAFPDVYEVGMSYLGLQILYGLLNEQPEIWCERVFCPWPDREQQVRQEQMELCTLESQIPLRSVHILGFSLQHELLYTNVLTMLDLGGIPLLAKDRREPDPLVIAGGPCAYNPMPMTDFIDAFIIGEGEAVILEFCRQWLQLRESSADRGEMLHILGKIPGVFVPSLYETARNGFNEEFYLHPKYPDIPTEIEKRVISDFEHSYYPSRPIVPNTKLIHHRLVVEAMRGCPGGCRFCQAGYTDRPVRERSPARILQDTRSALTQTGYDEIGLLSLSTADYTQLPDLCMEMIREHYPNRTALSLPSLRMDSFPSEVVEEIQKVRSTGLTFAPEAGTERLRRAINKRITDEEIFTTIRHAVSANQDTVKFYFMVGLPTETDEDLQGIVDLVWKIHHHLRQAGKKRTTIHISLSPFSPKPHTAYQWYGQIPVEEILRRIRYISSRITHPRIKVSWHDPHRSAVEAALTRGDARLGAVIRAVFEQGGRFDEWQEHFSITRWETAFASQGLSLRQYAEKTYRWEDQLPWQLISVQIDPRYLRQEWEKTLRGEISSHCGNELCRKCSVCDGVTLQTVHAPKFTPVADTITTFDESSHRNLPVAAKALPENGEITRYQLKFSKTGDLRYASHHDLMAMVEAILRRAGIAIAFSEGFHPHPKIIFAAALPVGVESLGEYLEIRTTRKYELTELLRSLNQVSPVGLVWLEAGHLRSMEEKITAAVHEYKYEIECSIPYPAEEIQSKILSILKNSNWYLNLNLVEIRSEAIREGIKLIYTTRVEGGRYTKAEGIVELLRKILDIPIQIIKATRIEMFQIRGEGNRIPLYRRASL